jgi:hypothetical protein
MKVQKLLEAINQWHPKIGWWLDNDPVTFYHGTHESRLEGILKDGLHAPETGPTAGWVSLALEPNTALGYASMSGGEASFRAAGGKAKHVPIDERVCLVLQISQSYFRPKMAGMRGNLQQQRDRLTNKEMYESWVKEKSAKFNGEYKDIFDQEYYAACEIRLPKIVPAQFIKSSMKK